MGIYHYPQESRDAFLAILRQLGARVWIPYQVALEFQRNRLSRIKDAGRELDKLDSAIASARALPAAVAKLELEKRGLGAIDLSQPVEALNTALVKLQEFATAARAVLPSASLGDDIREKLSAVFEKHVGTPPANQAALEALIGDAKTRFENQIPPG